MATKLSEKLGQNSIYLTSKPTFKIAQENQSSQKKTVIKGFDALKTLKKEISENKGEDKTTVINNISTDLLNDKELEVITNNNKETVLAVLSKSNAELFSLHPYRINVNAKHYETYVALLKELVDKNSELKSVYYKSDGKTPEFFRALFNVASEATAHHDNVQKHIISALEMLSDEDISFYKSYKNKKTVNELNSFLNNLGKENKGKSPVYKKYQTANKLGENKDGFADKFKEYRHYLHLVHLIEGQYWLDNCHLIEKINSELQRHIFKLEKDLHYVTTALGELGILHFKISGESSAFPSRRDKNDKRLTEEEKRTSTSRYKFQTGVSHKDKENCYTRNGYLKNTDKLTCLGCHKQILKKLSINIDLTNKKTEPQNIRNFIAHNHLIREPRGYSLATLINQLDSLMSYNRAYFSNVRDGVITRLTKQYLQLDKDDYGRLGRLTIDQLFVQADGKVVENGVYFKPKTIQYTDLALYNDWVVTMLRDLICLETDKPTTPP